VILETSDKRFHGSLAGAFYSNIIPVRMDKSEGVQVVLVSPYRAVFLQMIFILMLSILLILFVAYAIFYQMNSLLKEKHLRQLHTDFSHALTHDMATPLQTIAQVNSLLANENLYNDPDKRAKYIDIARQQILNLQALTDRILTVARAEKSAIEVNLSPVNLKEIILPLADKFKVQANKPVEFEVSFSPEHINLQADATLLSNAVSNLIDNAVKYSGNSVTINIRCEQKDNNVFLHIKDNGYGMSEKDQAKVFTMFERGKAVVRQQAKGFGLGLSYVKSVVEAHGGAVNLSSKEGEGAEFVLVLPLC
jgi:two-component system phosphate regulon sensor histidine kinase PhoR